MPTSAQQWDLFYWLVGIIGVLMVGLAWWFRWEQERQRRNLHHVRNHLQAIIKALLRTGIEVKRDDYHDS